MIATPWKFDENTMKVWDANDMPICIPTLHDGAAGRKANARLLAAAPELLYALKRALAVISQHHPENAECCARDIETIKTAIANAE